MQRLYRCAQRAAAPIPSTRATMHNGGMNPLLSRTAALVLVGLAFVGLGMLPASPIPPAQHAGATLAYFDSEEEAWEAGMTDDYVDPALAEYIAGSPDAQPVLRFDNEDQYTPAMRYIEPEVYSPWPAVDAARVIENDPWRTAEMAPEQPYLFAPGDVTTADILQSLENPDEIEEMDRLESLHRGFGGTCNEHGCEGDQPSWLVPEDDACTRYGDCEDPLMHEDEDVAYTQRYPVYADDEDVAYTRAYPVYAEEDPWYETMVPVSSWGCTYFGTGCDTEETRYSITYRAEEPRSSGWNWGGIFYQPLFGGSSSGGSTSFSIPVNTVSTGYANYAPEPPPQCSIRMSPNNADYGTHIFLSWDSVNAVKAQIDGMGNIPTNGFHGFTATENKTLTMRVFGERGTAATCSAQLVVVGAQSAQCSIAASATQVKAGNPVQLRWIVPNALRVELSDFGPAGSEGSLVVYPERTTTYALRAIGRDGKVVSCNTTVQVGNTAPTNGGGIGTDETGDGLGAEFYRYFGVDINRQR